MGTEEDLSASIGLIYESMFDSALWARALTQIADTMGSGQVALRVHDRCTNTCSAVTPRTDPDAEAAFKARWAFDNPIFLRRADRTVREIFTLESLIPRRDFVATAFFNEWYRPAQWQTAMLGTNLRVENQISTALFASNPPGKDEITNEQTHIFKTAVKHIDRAIHFHRELRLRDLDHDTAPERLEHLPRGVMLVDAAARLLYANAAARQLLDSGPGLSVKDGCLHSGDSQDAIQGLIASCGQKILTRHTPGGELSICLGPRQSLRVTVTPLRSKGTVAELPWLGLLIPAAIVTVPALSSEVSLN
jgi:PAS domain-containing protein